LLAEFYTIYRSLISLSLLLTFITVALSAYIRLADVGIGCEDWPACYAQLNPQNEKRGVTVLTQEGQQMAHYGARVAHRYIASVLGLFILAVYIMALRQGRARATGLLVPTAMFAIMVFLSLLGYYTPTRSNPLITMGNLLGGMSLLGLLWWMMQRDVDTFDVPGTLASYRPLAILALCLVSLQLVLGGWGSANFASASCPGLLSCDNEVLAVANVAEAFNPLREVQLDDSGAVIREPALGLLSMTHRVFALLTAAYLAWLVRKLKARPELRATLLALSAFSISQIVVGVSTVWLDVPLLLLSLHNILAACLLMAAINLLHRLTPAAESALPE